MERLVREGVRSGEVAELAELTLHRYGARPNDERSQIRAVHAMLRDGLFYVHDPRGLETLRDARIMASKVTHHFQHGGRKPLADCDDFTILGRAVLEHLGYETKSRAVGTRKAGMYNHVYPMARLKDGSWVGLEATVPGARAFWAPPSTKTPPLDYPNVQGLNGLDGPIETAAAGVLRQVLPQTLAPAVEQLKTELKFLRYAIFGLAAAGFGAAWYFIQKSRTRRAA